MFVCVTSFFDNAIIWFDSGCFVALEQNVDDLTGNHTSTDIYLLCGNETLRFTVIDTPDDIIGSMCS